MKKFNLLLILCIATLVSISSCKKDDPDVPNDEEVITTLNFTLTPDGGGTAVVLSFQDLDGEGGNAPVVTGGTLQANTTYNGSLVLLNETETPAGDITAEIQSEDEDHQFFFQSSNANVTVAYNDMDENDKPVGLATIVTTTDASMGTLTVILKHKPVKDAAGVSDGNIANASGETDIEVTFAVDVQ